MDALTFGGQIGSGKGRHSELVIPGRITFPNAPHDWPAILHPGSLNVYITESGYPEELLARCPGTLVQKLDSQMFSPAFEIPHDAIKNNRLKPKPNKPRRGDAQVWRATLLLSDGNAGVECWVFRRFWSTIERQLEIVSEKHLRTELGLADGADVTVQLFGTWNAE
ncbi:MAG: DUF120 domain-containing protein [Planctomycetota bacterium]|jgi:CTP-dependent riboflavin kinase